MKTIIVKTVTGNRSDLTKFIEKLEKHADKMIPDCTICTRYLSADNINTTIGEIKDAVAIDDFHLFIIGVNDSNLDVSGVIQPNKARTFQCDNNELEKAKNFVVMI